MEEIEENEHFRAHALQVTESVSLAVSTLDDMDDLVSILKQLGAAHSPHGLQNAHYDVRLFTYSTSTSNLQKLIVAAATIASY